MLELTRNYRAENDADFKEFITDLRMVKNGGKACVDEVFTSLILPAYDSLQGKFQFQS